MKMDEQDYGAISFVFPLGMGMFLVALFLSSPGYANLLYHKEITYRPASTYYYYPDHYTSPYNYQSTGDFANRPLVIPPSVPVLRQPDRYYVGNPYRPLSKGVYLAPTYGQSVYNQPVYGQAAFGQPALNQPVFRQPVFGPPAYGIRPMLNPPAPMSPVPHPSIVGGFVYPPKALPVRSMDQGLFLHVGSFLVYEKAGSIEKKVQALGLKTARKEVSAEGIRYLKLLVGPFQTKEKMKQAAALLDENEITNRVEVR